MELSKRKIDELGNIIRNQGFDLSGENLENLQNYRITYKEPLSNVFNILCKLSNIVHGSSIVTFRIKRIESIISKTIRISDQRFSRMWDIGGCRCIVRNEKDIYRLHDYIKKQPKLEIVKIKDYILEPKDDGYRSLHLYVKHSENDRIIEIQIRSKDLHNWATLVEITDLLFETKLKELGNNKELLRFHKLLSNNQNLSNNEKADVVKIISDNQYFEKLSLVFARNYIKVRQQWLELESKKNHRYYLIESYKDKVPSIISFENFQDAENRYFELYKSSEKANIIMTHLKSATYSQISLAYSNYILTFHSFLYECLTIIENLIEETLVNKKFIKFRKYLKLYSNLLYSLQYNFVREINIASPLIQNNLLIKNKNKKSQEWYQDLIHQRSLIEGRTEKFSKKLRNNIPKFFLYKALFNKQINIIDSKHRAKMDKVISENFKLDV